MTRSPGRPILGTLAVLLILAFPAGTAAGDGLEQIRDATAPFRDVAAAEAAGYGILAGTPLEECIDEPGEGAMGVHHVNGDLVGDTVLEPTSPEALVYIPRPDGGMRLVAVEYVVFAEAWDTDNADPPALFGREFHLITEPNRYELPAFYELHAWAWKDNPSGTFYEWNPDVSCDPQLPPTSMAGADGATPAVPLPIVLVVGLCGFLGVFALAKRLATMDPRA